MEPSHLNNRNFRRLMVVITLLPVLGFLSISIETSIFKIDLSYNITYASFNFTSFSKTGTDLLSLFNTERSIAQSISIPTTVPEYLRYLYQMFQKLDAEEESDSSITETKGLDPSLLFERNSVLVYLYAKAAAQYLIPYDHLMMGNRAVYIAPLFEPGIPIAHPNYKELMNHHIYMKADNLLSLDSPIWKPEQGSYFGYYNSYLEYASPLKKKTDDRTELNELITTRLKNMKQASDDMERIKDDAIQKYIRVFNRTALVDSLQNLTQWIEIHDERYRLAKRVLETETYLYNEVRKQAYGSNIDEINDLLKGCLLARDYLNHVPGFNMPCTAIERSQNERIYEAYLNHNPNLDKIFKPEYTLPDYADMVMTWMRNFNIDGRSRTALFNISLDEDRLDRLSWKGLGFHNIPDIPTSKCNTTLRDLLTINHQRKKEFASVTTIAMTFSDIGSFDINRGSWHKADFKKSFRHFRDDTPDEIRKKVVKPTRFLFGYGMQIELKVKSDTLVDLKDILRKAKSEAFLLGIPCDFEIREGSIVTIPQHPGYPHLLAVLGERI